MKLRLSEADRGMRERPPSRSVRRSWPPHRSRGERIERVYFYLIGLTFILGYAIIADHDAPPASQRLILISATLLTLAYCMSTSCLLRAPGLPRGLKWLLFMLPAYAILQVVPLPITLVSFLSPSRVTLGETVTQGVGVAEFLSITLSTSSTTEHLIRIVTYILLAFLVREATWRLQDQSFIAALPLVVIGFVEGALGWVQHFVNGPEFFVSGTYGHHSHYALLLNVSLAFGVVFALSGRSFRNGTGRPGAWHFGAIGWAVVLAIIWGAVIVSYSRTGFVASLLVLATTWVLWFGRERAVRGKVLVGISAMTVGALLFVFMSPDLLISRFGSLLTAESVSTHGPIPRWFEAAGVIRQYPLVGCGLGSYSLGLQSSRPGFQSGGHVVHAESDYLEGISELGVVGFGICIGLVGSLAARGLQVSLSRARTSGRILGMACVAALGAIALQSMTDYQLYIPGNAMVLAWVLGICAGLDFRNRSGVEVLR